MMIFLAILAIVGAIYALCDLISRLPNHEERDFGDSDSAYSAMVRRAQDATLQDM